MKHVISSTKRKENSMNNDDSIKNGDPIKRTIRGVKFNRPTLITITAPTCSGKSYLLNALTHAGLYGRIVSTTTRPPRDREKHGHDYDFIDLEQSRYIEKSGGFAELIEFHGTRYGVTHAEMQAKMSAEVAPIVILEPQGLEAYEKLCQENNWGIFSVYVYTQESVRIERLNFRTCADIQHAAVQGYLRDYEERCVAGSVSNRAKVFTQFEKIMSTHSDRILSITGDERRWSHMRRWDALVPGDDLHKAVADIEQAIEWRNKKELPQVPYVHA